MYKNRVENDRKIIWKIPTLFLKMKKFRKTWSRKNKFLFHVLFWIFLFGITSFTRKTFVNLYPILIHTHGRIAWGPSIARPPPMHCCEFVFDNYYSTPSYMIHNHLQVLTDCFASFKRMKLKLWWSEFTSYMVFFNNLIFVTW